MSTSKHSAVLASMATSKKLAINSEESCSKSTHKKTSVEDLAEVGYTIGRVFGEGSYSKVK